MATVDEAVSYVKYRESLLRETFESNNFNFFKPVDYVLKPLPLETESDHEFQYDPECVNNLDFCPKLNYSDLCVLFKTDIYKAVDQIFSHLVNVLLLIKLGYPVKPNLKVYKVILSYFGRVEYKYFRVRVDFKYNAKVNKSRKTLKVFKCHSYKSKRYLLSYIYRLLNSCLFVKRSVWGFKIFLNDLLKIINYIAKYKINKSEWETKEIIYSEYEYGLLSLSHFISSLLFNGNISTDLLLSRYSRWKGFDLKYFKEIIVMLVFMNALNSNKFFHQIYYDFISMLNFSFTESWNLYSSINTNNLNKYLGYIRQLYVVMNMESPFYVLPESFKFSHPRPYIPKNLVLDDRYNLQFTKYMLFVIKMMLSDATSSNILVIIELIVHYFTYNTLKFGFLKCPIPHRCLKCTSIFTEIYLGLMEILETMRTLNFYYSHLPLVRMLVKNEIERLKISFFGSYYEPDLSSFIHCYRFNMSVIPDILERSLTKHHYSPKYSKFLKYKMCLRLLKRCINNETSIFIKENSLSSFSKCSWYLKLLFCVDTHVKKVDATVAINRCLWNTTYLHLDQLSYQPPRKEFYKVVFPNNNVLVDELDILHNLYATKPSIDQYLSVFALSDKLNIIQRTQACLMLSKNLKFVEIVLEQLVQCLFIDPGDRIINLLYIALNNNNIKNKILYYLSCLIHSNINNSTNHKIYTFIKFIFNLLPDESKNIYGNQIVLHGRLLDLTLNLGNLPLSKRYDELNKKILEICQYIKDESNLYLYNESETSCLTTKSIFNLRKGVTNENNFDVTNNSNTMGMNNKDNKDNKNNKNDNKNNKSNKDKNKDNNNKVENDKIVGINFNSVKILNSATRVPFLLTYNLKSGAERTYIYKMKDDLRQDCLAIQMKHVLLHVFRTHELEVFLQPFLVVPYSCILGEIFSKSKINDISLAPHFPRKDFEIGGVVGFIPDTISRHNIGKEFGVSIKHFFLKRFGHEFSPNYIKAVNNFVTSLAGYALLSFLLQVKDRHNGNLLFTTSGHIIHIDFGFILGASPGKDLQFELAPFKFTQEMVDFMGGISSENFRKFIHLLLNSYMALRTHSNLVITLVQLLQYSKIPCFRKSTLTKLKRRLRLKDSPADAKNYIMRKIFYALNSKTTKLYDFVQNYQQGIQH